MVCGVGSVLTADNLRKWGVVIVLWCFMCKKIKGKREPFIPTLHSGLGDVVYDLLCFYS